MKTQEKNRKGIRGGNRSNSNARIPIAIVGLMLMLLLGFGIKKAKACDFCNNKFHHELANERSGTLVAKELLAAINGQKMIAEAKPVKPIETAQATEPVKPTATSKPAASKKEPLADFPDIIARDNKLPLPATSYVPQGTTPDRKVKVELFEGEVYAGNGVMYKGFVMNGTIPGPSFEFEEGDIIEITFENKGNIVHGASIHAAYTQTSKYLGKIEPGQSKSFTFKVNHPGVYMYHCAPGGHAIPMHIIFGQYGTMVVKPKKKFKLEQILGRKPDVEITLAQHEFYASGKDAVEGQGKPMYTAFNGKIFRYVEEPIKAKPGDYVRINYINLGPNLFSTFHIVGIIWDYAYWQGNPDNIHYGGQSVTSGPTDSWVIEFRMPADEGAYLMLSHSVGSTDRGAIGLLMCDKDAVTPVKINSDGPNYTSAEMADFKAKSRRTISPFEPGTLDVDPVHIYGPEVKEVTIKIIGNSFYPKRVKVTPGTKITWINEDVFTYMEGEFSGIHNAVAIGDPPERFASPLLAHAETYSHVFTKEGDYSYMCTPHPYMKAEITVEEATEVLAASAGPWGTIFLALIGIVIALIAFFKKK
ncbi:MAG: multicopper oxidase domain-containing protein [Bacteroidetes bacterium]|nr:multicopper oxidase domain-containing protein [Bacteroidota bacterium]